MDRTAELQTLHADLARRLADLERLTKAPAPDLRSLTEARLNLTRASRRRTEYIENTVLPLVLDAVVDVGEVAALRKDIATRRAASSDHISRWHPSEIERDWSGYQKASEAMRTAMRAQIRREQELLYPLLRKVAGT